MSDETAKPKPKLEIVSPPSDALDLSDLWLDTNLGDPLTSTYQHSIPVGKPKDFFRVHPDRSMRRHVEIYVHKPEEAVEEQHFIVNKSMQGRLLEARPAILVVCIYRDGSLRVWPLRLAKEGEKDNDAWKSARNAARKAMSTWIRIVWARRAYEIREAHPGYAPDPDLKVIPPFEQLVMKAYGSQGIISDPDHFMVRELMGAPPQSRAGSEDGDDDL
jgi:hypothetical protein